jgi:hypothetical protein
MSKKKIKIDIKKNRKIFTIAVIAIVILSILLIIINNTKDYTKVKVKSNDKTIFSISDLKLNNLEFGNSEKKVKKELGEPNKEKEITKDVYSYKKLYYKGLTVLLRENYNDYILVGVEVKSRKYSVGRNIKVNDSIIKTIKKFKVDNESGNYIYGNYSVNSLTESEITDNIYIGVREKNELLYVNRDAIVDSGNTNIARLDITYKRGKITKIIWSYDFE